VYRKPNPKRSGHEVRQASVASRDHRADLIHRKDSPNHSSDKTKPGDILVMPD